MNTLDGLRAGRLSPEKECSRAFNNIKEENGAFITVTEERALAAARRSRGTPLAGLTVAVKDNICIKDVPMTCASRMLDGFIPPYTATAVSLLEEAGASVTGKTNLDEFAMGSTGLLSALKPVRNPLVPDRIPGGSSSGSAAAAAEGACEAALGSDTGGSVRIPAAFCGVVGLKPTYGAVGRHGLTAFASSLDTVGIIARDVKTVAAIADVICRPDENDMTSVAIPFSGNFEKICETPLAPVRFFIPNEAEEYAEARAARELLGARDTSFTGGALGFLDDARTAYEIISCVEAASDLARYDGIRYGISARAESVDMLYKKNRSLGFGREVKERIMRGIYYMTGGRRNEYYDSAVSARREICKKMCNFLPSGVLMITPTAPFPAPRVNDGINGIYTDKFTVPANLAGLPAISVPIKLDGEVLGIQITGGRGRDADVLHAAFALERRIREAGYEV